MLKITDEHLKRAADLSDSGVTKNLLIKFYRTDGMSMTRIAKHLSESHDNSITLKDVNSLVEYFSIPRKTAAEQKRDNKKRPINMANLISKSEYLKDNGFTKEKIHQMYTSGLSKNEIISEINSSIKSSAVNKDSINKIFLLWEISERTSEEMNVLRMDQVNKTMVYKRENEAVYGKGYKKSQIIELYDKGESLSSISRKTGIAVVTASKIIQDAGLSIRKSRNFKEILSDLESKGLDQDIISQEYFSKSMTQSQLNSWLSGILNYQISEKSVRNIVAFLKSSK